MIDIVPHSLVILVGPSGAGKSTLAAKYFSPDEIISSDAIRQELFGDFKCQANPGIVFNIFRNRIEKRLSSGLRAVADATHLSRRERMSTVFTASHTNAKIYYLIVNRPVDEKLKTGGWRLEVPNLIERHHIKFNDSLKNILNGDGENITVIDTSVDEFRLVEEDENADRFYGS